MPKYKVLAKSYVFNRIVEEGEIIEFDGKPSSKWELIEEEKKPMKKAEKPSKPVEAPLAE